MTTVVMRDIILPRFTGPPVPITARMHSTTQRPTPAQRRYVVYIYISRAGGVHMAWDNTQRCSCRHAKHIDSRFPKAPCADDASRPHGPVRRRERGYILTTDQSDIYVPSRWASRGASRKSTREHSRTVRSSRAMLLYSC
eukprot:9487994-Pyramimonas_sp.AAC.1